MPLLEQLVRDEGLKLKPYRDSVGKLTIGVGRNLDDVGISHDEALLLLQHDVQPKLAALKTQYPQLDECRLAALVNMAFNMGLGGLGQFHDFLAAVQAGDWNRAALEMLDSEWARQVGDRAKRLAKQIQTGEWQ